MTNVLHRNLKIRPPIAGGSTGRHVLHETLQRDPDRKVRSGFLDLSSGAGVTGLGHSNMRVKDAMIEQIRTMPYVHAAQWTSAVTEEAAHAIIERSGPHFKRGGVTFFSGGSEAIEAACKIALQLCEAWGKPAPMFIARRHSYHGGTFFALMLGDHPRKDQLKEQRSIQHNCLYQFDAYAPHLFEPKLDGLELRGHEDACIASLHKALDTVKLKGGTAIIVMETIGGTTLAIAPPSVTYLESVRSLANEYGAIIIADEILGGNFRTGRLMAWQHYQARTMMNIAPDIVVMGKGITAGYFPMSCVMVSTDVRYFLENTSKASLWATSTNQNHPVGCAAVIAAMDEYDKLGGVMNDLANVLRRDVMPRLRLMTDHVTSTQGVGNLWGVCFNPDAKGLHLSIKKQLFDAGVSVYTDGGTVEGRGNMLLFAPPFTTTSDDLELACDAIGNLSLD